MSGESNGAMEQEEARVLFAGLLALGGATEGVRPSVAPFVTLDRQEALLVLRCVLALLRGAKLTWNEMPAVRSLGRRIIKAHMDAQTGGRERPR